MAVLTNEEFMSRIENIIGERDDDDALNFLQDTRDTLDSYSNANNENWKQKYEENDATWRKRYRDTFFNGPQEPIEEPVITHDKPKTFDELFKEE